MVYWTMGRGRVINFSHGFTICLLRLQFGVVLRPVNDYKYATFLYTLAKI